MLGHERAAPLGDMQCVQSLGKGPDEAATTGDAVDQDVVLREFEVETAEAGVKFKETKGGFLTKDVALRNLMTVKVVSESTRCSPVDSENAYRISSDKDQSRKRPRATISRFMWAREGKELLLMKCFMRK